LAIQSAEPVTVEKALGANQAEEFAALSEFHSDGWGAAWFDEAEIHGHISTKKADRDPDYVLHASKTAATEQILHLRWASKGMRNMPSNSHPFIRNGFAFIHNGEIAATDILDEMLNDDARKNLKGSTDSERIFAYILQCRKTEHSTEKGLAKAIGSLSERFSGHSLNSMLLHDGRIYTVNVHKDAPFDLTDYPEKQGNLPWGHDREHYHDLCIRKTDHCLMIVSTGMRSGAWKTLPEGRIYVAERVGGEPVLRTVWQRSGLLQR
jgi:predicted glutamine amidotransferase